MLRLVQSPDSFEMEPNLATELAVVFRSAGFTDKMALRGHLAPPLLASTLEEPRPS